MGVDGRPSNIRVLSSLGMGLDEKAIEAVKNWKFEPAMKDGHPVRVEIAVEVDFHSVLRSASTGIGPVDLSSRQRCSVAKWRIRAVDGLQHAFISVLTISSAARRSAPDFLSRNPSNL